MAAQSPPACLQAALLYLSKGWSPIPLCPPDHEGCPGQHQKDCQRPGKAPLWGWSDYQERLPREGELKMYWARNRHSNVGIAMGPVSGLLGLDIDGSAGEALLQELSKGNIPITLEFTTPNQGRRLFFRHPEIDVSIQSFAVLDQEALRILAKGSQTVAPPSRHVLGGIYEWIAGRGPADLEPAPCPNWLLSIVQENQKKTSGGEVGLSVQQSQSPVKTANHTFPVNRAIAYLKRCQPATAGEGTAQNYTFRLACALVHGFGLSEEEGLYVFNSGWNQRCLNKDGQPFPWSDTELLHKLQDARSKGSFPNMLNGHAKPPPPSHDIPSQIINLSTVEQKTVEWLWPNYIPLGKLSVLDGDPDLGKSTILLDLAARVSTNGIMPNNAQGVQGGVVILSAEDGVDDTIMPRLKAAGANLNNILAITEVHGNPPVLPKDIPEIEGAITSIQGRLLVIDPLTAYLSADTRSDQEIRKTLYPLHKMADRTRCAVVYLRHLNKGSGTKAMYRGGGSIAIIGAARAGFMVGANPDNPQEKVFAHTKHNLGPGQPSLLYVLDVQEGGVCKVNWIGETTLKADDFLQPSELPEEKSAKQEAIDLLEAMLQDGERPAEECYAQARKNKISDQTLRRAKLALQIVATKDVDDQGKFIQWRWSLPLSTGALDTPQST